MMNKIYKQGGVLLLALALAGCFPKAMGEVMMAP